MWFGWGFMILGPLFLVFIAVAVYHAITSSSRGGYHSHYQQSIYRSGRALEILKERYAKGEITKEQFLWIKDELMQ